MLTLFSCLVFLATGLISLGGAEAGCTGGEPFAWCTVSNKKLSSPIFIESSKSLSTCKTVCEDETDCKSVSYLRDERSCFYFDSVGDESTLEDNAESDHHWLNCGASSCPDTDPEPTTAEMMEDTTTTTVMVQDDTTTTTVMVQDDTTTVMVKDDTTTVMVKDDTTTSQREEMSSAAQDTSTSTTEASSWLKIKPVWAAMIGMGIFAALLIIIIFALICTLKSRQSSASSKEKDSF